MIEDLVKSQLALMRTQGLPPKAIPYQEFLEMHEVTELWVRMESRKELEKAIKDTPNLWSLLCA